ncbi:MAG TPA: peptide synthase, partial [Desulfobacterales bacterium]|nr:peptide synthase [Desulfobacterales bacterium]
MTVYSNITLSLKKSQEKYPFKRAIVYPAGRDKKGRVLYSQMTFTQLERQSDKLAFGLERIGIIRGTRT